VNENKPCESAYLAASDPTTGPYMHGAAMVDRTSGTTHVWLVRGRCSESVVDELQRQLIKSGRLRSTAIRARRGHVSLLATLAISLLAAGLHAVLYGLGAAR
jgi:hypothetical protein